MGESERFWLRLEVELLAGLLDRRAACALRISGKSEEELRAANDLVVGAGKGEGGVAREGFEATALIAIGSFSVANGGVDRATAGGFVTGLAAATKDFTSAIVPLPGAAFGICNGGAGRCCDGKGAGFDGWGARTD